MAAGTVRLGGYFYEFTCDVPDKLKCSVCLLPLKSPMQVLKCGHRFCKLCINPVLDNPRARCPVDRQSISKDKVFEDAACEREVLDLHVKCPSLACVWSGELRDLENHEATCQFKLVECKNEGCNKKVMRSSIEDHVTTHCEWRTSMCMYCQKKYTWSCSQEHNDSCENYPLSCVNNCGKHRIPRHQMAKHIKDVCPSAVIPCKYKHVGCQVKIRRASLRKHVKKNMEKHLDLACSKLKQLENTPCSHRLNSISFIWKISEFDQRWQEAKAGVRNVIYSDPFYTSPQGYKMRVRLYPNGGGNGEGSHISVFIVVMKGEYDGALTWPFLPKFSFTLIDQQEDGSKRENISKNFITDSTQSAYFKKPVDEANRGWGFPKCVSHDKLQTRRYIVDNTIFLKIEVEVPQENR